MSDVLHQNDNCLCHRFWVRSIPFSAFIAPVQFIIHLSPISVSIVTCLASNAVVQMCSMNQRWIQPLFEMCRSSLHQLPPIPRLTLYFKPFNIYVVITRLVYIYKRSEIGRHQSFLFRLYIKNVFVSSTFLRTTSNRVTDEALIAETMVWPNFFLMNVFFALKGSKKYYYFFGSTFFLSSILEIVAMIRPGTLSLYVFFFQLQHLANFYVSEF